MNINYTEYIDGFYKLSTKIKGSNFSITYSENTDVEAAIADFREQVRQKVRNVPSMPSNLTPDGFGELER